MTHRRKITLTIVVFVIIGIVATGVFLRDLLPSRNLESQVTRTVREEIIRISATQGDRLELAIVETRETFRDSDTLKLYGVSLGTTTAEISVPVIYRFFVNLREGVSVETRRHGDLLRCVVRAPKLRPQLPPAFNTAGMEKRAESGWARWNAGDNLAFLEKSLTAEVTLRAPQKVALAEDKARKALAGFVSRWLLKDGLGGPDGVREIVVLFPGEEDKPGVATPILP